MPVHPNLPVQGPIQTGTTAQMLQRKTQLPSALNNFAPNPVAQVNPSPTAPATVDGVQQALKIGAQNGVDAKNLQERLSAVQLRLMKMADTVGESAAGASKKQKAVSGGSQSVANSKPSASGARTSSNSLTTGSGAGTQTKNPMSSPVVGAGPIAAQPGVMPVGGANAQAGQMQMNQVLAKQNPPAMLGGMPTHPGVAARPGPGPLLGGPKLAFFAAGMPGPNPGLTANSPTPPGPRGSAPMPTNGPLPPPPPPQFLPNGAPNPNGSTGAQMPPQGAPGQIPAPTPPMAEPMAQTLPANPRPLPPAPMTVDQTRMSHLMPGIIQDQAISQEPMNAAEAQDDIQSEAMGMGVKTSNSKSAFGKQAAPPPFEDAPPHMRGWEWSSLQQAKDDGKSQWFPRQFPADATPLTELLASPARQGLLAGATGAGLGGFAGHAAAPFFGADPRTGAAVGAGAAGLLSSLAAYINRRNRNDEVEDAMRFIPPGATVGDYKALQKARTDDSKSAFGNQKLAAQDNSAPAVTATGESNLRANNPSDQYLQGGDAWASISKSFRGHKTRKRQPDFTQGCHKASALAMGFQRYCRDMGLPDTLVRMFAEKAAEEFGPEVAEALGVVKKANVFTEGLGRFVKQVVPKFFRNSVAPAAQNLAHYAQGVAAPAAAHGPWGRVGGMHAEQLGRIAAPVARQAAPTLGGALTGGIAGDDLNLPGGHTSVGPFHLNTGGMLAGAAAANPSLRRLVGNAGMGRGVAEAAMTGIRGAGMGSLAGSAVDQMLNQFGVDTGNAFGRMGAFGGLGAGAARTGLQRAGVGNNTVQALTAAGHSANQFGWGATDPVINALTYVPRKVINSATGPNRAGGLMQRLGQSGAIPGMSGEIGQLPFRGSFMEAHKSAPEYFGRLTGLAGLGAAGVGVGNQLIQNKVNDYAANAAANVYSQAAPMVQGDIDNYMRSRGLTNEQGQFDPVRRGIDTLLGHIGLDPAQTSLLQRLMLGGGAAAAGAGLLTDRPYLAGGGAALAAYPYLRQMLGHHLYQGAQ